jgi:electron transport complex protein RnfD
MEKMLQVSSSPHVRSKARTGTLMLLVVIALWPAACFGVWLNGPWAAAVLGVSIGTAVLTEYLYEKLMKKPVTVSDCSAVVTGLLLGMNLPPQVPLWMPALGSLFAILVVKQLFGGLGQNFMNPALAGRCFLMISFSARMTSFAVADGTLNKIVDTVSGATPLAEIRAGGSFDLLSMFLGTTRGTIGETSTLALLIGAAFLVAAGVIRLTVPLAYLASFSAFALLFGGHGFDLPFLAAQLCGGGLMLGAWFMATDYVTRPITAKGQLVYGILLGLMTGLFRFFGGSAEGVSYAIIFCNLLVPLIERLTLPGGFGVVRKRGGGKA